MKLYYGKKKSKVIIVEEGEHGATVFNVPLGRTQIEARLSGLFMSSEKMEVQYVDAKAPKESRQRGRPKATEKSLADYACPGIDVERLRAEIAQRLSQTLGTAECVAQLEKALIAEYKIKAPIPYNLLKAEFGELIHCERQNLNYYERLVHLR